MAAGFLPLPGTQIGPCKHDCDHRDCVETKSIAASPCVRCGDAIGFDIGFYTSGDQHVHARCEEEAIELAFRGGGR